MQTAWGHDSEQEAVDQEVVDNVKKRTKSEYVVWELDGISRGRYADHVQDRFDLANLEGRKGWKRAAPS